MFIPHNASVSRIGFKQPGFHSTIRPAHESELHGIGISYILSIAEHSDEEVWIQTAPGTDNIHQFTVSKNLRRTRNSSRLFNGRKPSRRKKSMVWFLTQE